jgi:hypothetical protein
MEEMNAVKEEVLKAINKDLHNSQVERDALSEECNSMKSKAFPLSPFSDGRWKK